MSAAIRVPAVLQFAKLAIDSPLTFSKCIKYRPMVVPSLSRPLNRSFTTEEKPEQNSQSNLSQVNGEKSALKSDTSDLEKKYVNELERLNKELISSTDKKNEFEDKYKRALADGENLRRRLSRQIEEAKQFGVQSLCKDLLEVADILGAATESVPKEEVTDKNPHLKNLYEGLTMTSASLKQVFKRHGLEIVNPLNEKFNPNLHEALFQQDAEGAAPDTVVSVRKVGYKLHERCIRPALVGVSKGS